MRRREFIALVGGAAACRPLAALAQQSAMPVMGFLRNTSAASSTRLMTGFHRGLGEMGYVEGRNVTIEYRWADHGDDEVREMAADLVRRQVAVIATGGGTTCALAAKRATDVIPIVFEGGGDPVKFGLVASLNRPGGNVTGVALFSNRLGPKRVELLKSIVPARAPIGVLADPTNAAAKDEVPLLLHAAASAGVDVAILNASTAAEIDAAFASAAERHIRGVLILATPLFVAQRDRIIALAARHAIAVIYPFRSFVEAGGLMSYGDDLVDAFRQLGVYSGRVLRGEKPADLPVVQPTKFELVVNLKAAKALGMQMPPTLLALADEVIE